jgi:phosphatidate cytidylyltransferase
VTAAAAPSSRLGTLVSRAIVTVIAAGGFAGLCWADATGTLNAGPAWWLAPAAVILAAGAAVEATQMAAARGVTIDKNLVPLATAAVPVAAVGASGLTGGGATAALGWAAVAVAAGVAAMFLAALTRYRPGGGSLGRVAGGLLVVVAIGLPLAFMVGLRLLGGQRGWGGVLPLVSMIAVVKGGDIAAYVVGSLIGRRKLAPVVSPGKTWEGAAASLAASLGIAWLLLVWSRPPGGGEPWGGWPVYGLAVGIAGMLGDLAESLVKRELAAKDSGRWLGGLGGCLDLIDAPLLAAPLAWVLWAVG